jgi:metal-responsive CopG/Arc/MetJ family transcriptional regulator
MTEIAEEIPFAKREKIMARLPEGSLARMDNVLRGGELRSKLMRDAILAEIERRERDRGGSNLSG